MAYASRKKNQIQVKKEFPVDENGVIIGGRTKQEFKKQCDVNHIIKTYDQTGLIAHVNKAQARFDDFTSEIGYQEALDTVIAAQDSFMELPSEIRKKFGNDPAQFLEFIDNPDNREAMIEMGLAEAVPVEVPLSQEIADAIAAQQADPVE